MDPSLYKASMQGDVKLLKELAERNSSDLLLSVTLQKNTGLHITARFGHTAFAAAILSLCPPLASQVNAKGETPLHIAARAGLVGLVELLTDNTRRSSAPASLGDVEVGLPATTGALPAWRMKDVENNTALHEALRGRHRRVALHLLEVDGELASFVNSAGESPLYLAAEFGLPSVMKRILRGASEFSRAGPDGRTPLHAAVFKRHIGVVKLLLEEAPDLVKHQDVFGRTALHYAAAMNIKLTKLLVEADSSIAYVTDNEGLSPPLVAARAGRGLTLSVILDYCPDSGESHDPSGRNILHLVIENKTSALRVKMLLKRPELKELINERDNDGNTALHLATKYHLYSIVQQLVAFKGVDLSAKNKEGLTALDISELNWDLKSRQTYIWTTLRRHGAGRGKERHWERVPFRMRLSLNHPDADLRSTANTVSVVAALLATISFTAAFTIPGGYQADGTAMLGREAALKAFVIADTVAMCSSMTVAFVLIWALLGDLGFLRVAVKWGLRILWMALLATVAAFAAGVYAVVAKECQWLGIAVCLAGCSVPLTVVLLFNAASSTTPYTMRAYPRNLTRTSQVGSTGLEESRFNI